MVSRRKTKNEQMKFLFNFLDLLSNIFITRLTTPLLLLLLFNIFLIVYLLYLSYRIEKKTAYRNITHIMLYL